MTPSPIIDTWPGTAGYPNPYGSAPPPQIQKTTFPDGHIAVSVTFKATYPGGTWSADTPIGQVNHFGVHVTGTAGVQTYTSLWDMGGHGMGSTGVGEFHRPVHGPAPLRWDHDRQLLPTTEHSLDRPASRSDAYWRGHRPADRPGGSADTGRGPLPRCGLRAELPGHEHNSRRCHQLVTGDPAVQSAEANSDIASTPELFQPDPGTNAAVEIEPADPVAAGDQATVTLTETYHYTGPVDPADNSATCNDIVGDANNCTNFVGTLIELQMESTQLNAVHPRARLSVRVQTGLVASGTGGNVTGVSLPAGANPSTLDCGSDCGACLVNVDDPSTVTLKATPNAGYIFHAWSGLCWGSATACTTSVTGAKSIVATIVLPIGVTSVSPSHVHPGQSAKSNSSKLTVTVIVSSTAALAPVTSRCVTRTGSWGSALAASRLSPDRPRPCAELAARRVSRVRGDSHRNRPLAQSNGLRVGCRGDGQGCRHRQFAQRTFSFCS